MGTRGFETFVNGIDGAGAVVSYSAQFRLEWAKEEDGEGKWLG